MKICQINMQIASSCLLLLVLFSTGVCCADSSVPKLPSIVSIQSKLLVVEKRKKNGTLQPPLSFKMRGISYSPVDVGETVFNFASAREHLLNSKYKSDFPKIYKLNANVVKTYIDLGLGKKAKKFLNTAYKNNLWVLITLVPDSAHAPGEPTNAQLVAEYKNHPALLGWVIGNEWNLNLFYKYGSVAAAVQEVEKTAQDIKFRDANHPVLSSVGFKPNQSNLGDLVLYSDLPAVFAAPSVDLWGVNIYRARHFDPWFMEWEQMMGDAPFFVSEFGADSWSATNLSTGDGSPDLITQRDVLLDQWDELHRNLSANSISNNCVGGIVFEWNDEWWKAPGSLFEQNYGGYASGVYYSDFKNGGAIHLFAGQFDKFANEEHWGLVRIDRKVKPAYKALKTAFRLGTLNTDPVKLTIQSQGGSGNASYYMAKRDSAFVFRYAAGVAPQGGRGINLAILDGSKGTVKQIKHYDTYDNTAGTVFSKCKAISDLIAGLPKGDIVMAAITDTGFTWEVGQCTPLSAALSSYCFPALNGLGASNLASVVFHQPWAMVAKVGYPELTVDGVGAGVCPAQMPWNFDEAKIEAYMPLDIDGDGIFDATDLDNDNDGVDDLVEQANGTDALDPSEY